MSTDTTALFKIGDMVITTRDKVHDDGNVTPKGRKGRITQVFYGLIPYYWIETVGNASYAENHLELA